MGILTALEVNTLKTYTPTSYVSWCSLKVDIVLANMKVLHIHRMFMITVELLESDKAMFMNQNHSSDINIFISISKYGCT